MPRSADVAVSQDDAPYVQQMRAHILRVAPRHGVTACLKCGGPLRFTKLRDGRTTGKCETRDCLHWTR
jgi:hypothetical protein